MNRETVSQKDLTQQLLDLGVTSGGVLLVHCSFSLVKPVESGPLGLILALQSALGSRGTLVMPSMPDDDDHPFDPQHTPCRGMGVVANTFWQLPNVLRSDSPHSFAAKGPQASAITAPHPVDVPHGLDSPVGRVYELDGQVLLLGVGHDANTTIHLAESLADFVRERQASLAWLNTLDDPDFTLAAKHPAGFVISAGDMLMSWVAHDMLHIRQLNELHYQWLGVQERPFSPLYAGEW